MQEAGMMGARAYLSNDHRCCVGAVRLTGTRGNRPVPRIEARHDPSVVLSFTASKGKDTARIVKSLVRAQECGSVTTPLLVLVDGGREHGEMVRIDAAKVALLHPSSSPTAMGEMHVWLSLFNALSPLGMQQNVEDRVPAKAVALAARGKGCGRVTPPHIASGQGDKPAVPMILGSIGNPPANGIDGTKPRFLAAIRMVEGHADATRSEWPDQGATWVVSTSHQLQHQASQPVMHHSNTITILAWYYSNYS